MVLAKFQMNHLSHFITVAMVLSHFLESFRNMPRIVRQLPFKVSRSLQTKNHSSSLFPDFCSYVSYIFWKIEGLRRDLWYIQKYSWALRPGLSSMSRDITFCTLTVNHDSVFWSVEYCLIGCRSSVRQKLAVYILLKVSIFTRVYLITYRESK